VKVNRLEVWLEPEEDVEAAAKGHMAEETVIRLRQVGMPNVQGKSMAEAI